MADAEERKEVGIVYLPTPKILNGHAKPIPECEWCLSKDITDSRVYPIEIMRDATTGKVLWETFACGNKHEWVVSGG